MEKKKNSFASGIGFILAASGSAVGLGNLWAFPYKTAQNGGAAFVILYIVCVIFIGFFAMVCDIFIGKRAQANAVSAFKKISKKLGWCGLCAIMVSALIICYYSVLGGWTLKYTASSYFGNANTLNDFSINTFQVIAFTCAFILISILIIMGGVKNGIEKMSKILMPLLFLIVIGIAIYSLTLGSGVKEGLEFFLKPDFSKIGPKQVLTAMGQAFYSLSIGMGIMISYGSYTGNDVNVTKSCVMICFFDTLVALFGGLAIFPAVAHFDPSLLSNSKGIVLMFVILPKVFESLGVIGKIVSFLFFAMVSIAAITSVVSLIEVVTQFVIQKFKFDRKKSALIVALICFMVSIPIGMSLGHVAIHEEAPNSIIGTDLLTFFDEMTNTVLMPVCALFSCICVGWIIKPKQTIKELKETGTTIPKFLEKVFPIMVKFITPILILIVGISGIVEEIRTGKSVVIIACAIFIIINYITYTVFFKNSETGTNDDEVLEEQK